MTTYESPRVDNGGSAENGVMATSKDTATAAPNAFAGSINSYERVNDMPLMDAALVYAAMGWPVFPLAPGTKIPLLRSPHEKGHGCKGECGQDGHAQNDATCDPGKVMKWWTDHPAANIGVKLHDAGVYVIDVDPRNDGRPISEWPDGAALDVPTLVADTPGGGTHSYFDATSVNGSPYRGKPDGVSGVDIKANGIAVLAPSRIQGAGAYRWRSGAAVPASCPAMDARVIKSSVPATTTDADSFLDDGGDPFDWEQARTPGAVPGGEQNDVLHAAASSLRALGVPTRVAVPMLRTVVDAFTDTRPEDPWTTGHADEMWARVCGAYESGDVVLLPASADRTTGGLVDGWSFLDTDEPDELPLWGSSERAALWMSGESLMIFGPPGAGKSTLAHLVVFARLGLLPDVLGFPVADDGRKVAYFAMDRPKQIKRAMRRLVRPDHKAVLTERLVFWPGPLPFGITSGEGRDTIRDWAITEGVGTVVIDSTKDVLPDASDEKSAGHYNLARQSCLAAGVEWIELHHNRKATGTNKAPNTLEDVYGNRWLTAGVGSLLSLWQDDPGTPLVTLRHIRGSGEKLFDTALVLDTRTGTFEIRGEQTLDDFIAAQTKGFTVKEAATALGMAKGGKIETIRMRIKRKVKAGELEERPASAGHGDVFIQGEARVMFFKVAK